MKQDKFLKVILILLALHLLYSNSILLTEMVSAKTIITKLMAVLFGLSYSLITVLVIAVYPRWYVFSISALLDGTAVFLKYFPFANDKTFFVLSAVYFATYTAFIVVISGMISKQKENQEVKVSQKQSANVDVEIETLLAEKKRLEWGLKRTKNEQARREKQRLIEIINEKIDKLSNKKAS